MTLIVKIPKFGLEEVSPPSYCWTLKVTNREGGAKGARDLSCHSRH